MTNPLEQLNSETIGKVYDDLAHPALQEAGKALGTVIGMLNVLVAPFERWQLESKAKTARFTQDLETKYNKIPPDKVIEPSLNIVARSLDAIKYNLDEEEIREYFLNLITSAMNIDKASDVHPSFVNKIQNLSAYDARVFKELYNNGPTMPIIKMWLQKPIEEGLNLAYENSKYLQHIPYIGFDLFPCVLSLPNLYGTDFLYDNVVAIQSLSQLGLITVSFSDKMEEQVYIQEFETLYDWDEISIKIRDDNPDLYAKHKDLNLALIPGVLQLTPLGAMFGKVCCEE